MDCAIPRGQRIEHSKRDVFAFFGVKPIHGYQILNERNQKQVDLRPRTEKKSS